MFIRTPMTAVKDIRQEFAEYFMITGGGGGKLG